MTTTTTIAHWTYEDVDHASALLVRKLGLRQALRETDIKEVSALDRGDRYEAHFWGSLREMLIMRTQLDATAEAVA